MDVNIVFLNENLQEDVCVIQPKNFKCKEFFNKVCKL
jgi:hypothetical protein